MQASTVMAVSALELANLSGMIPRGTTGTPRAIEAAKVSPELVAPAPRGRTAPVARH
jgi:hypothetical protein